MRVPAAESGRGFGGSGLKPAWRDVPCYAAPLCRSIKTLRQGSVLATDEEVEAAARQFVRKVSGYRTPSQANAEVFDAAVGEVAAATRRLLASLRVGGRTAAGR